MYIYLRSPNSLHSILTSVLCKKLSNIFSNSMCSTISVGPHGMVQPIAAAVLETFIMMNKDDTLHPRTMLAFIFANSGI